MSKFPEQMKPAAVTILEKLTGKTHRICFQSTAKDRNIKSKIIAKNIFQHKTYMILKTVWL